MHIIGNDEILRVYSNTSALLNTYNFSVYPGITECYLGEGPTYNVILLRDKGLFWLGHKITINGSNYIHNMAWNTSFLYSRSNYPHPCYLFLLYGTGYVSVFSKDQTKLTSYETWVANLQLDYTPNPPWATSPPPSAPPSAPPSSPSNTPQSSASSNSTTSYSGFLDDLLSNLAITTLNKIPGGRKIIPFLCFLVNLDELWLYQYH